MDKQSFTELLIKTFRENGLSELLDGEKCEMLFALTERLISENEKYNLTAITEPDMIILNHYADSAALALYIPKSRSVIDVGCGAGFPSLPLAILRPDLKITAVDSTAKRINYVNETARLLSLSNIEAVTMRAEEGGRDVKYREKFDIATARAVATMRVLCELCLPFVRLGGQMLAMKGKNAEAELNEAKSGIKLLGGGEIKTEKITLKSNTDEEFSHPIIVVAKQSKTPAAYPRQYSQISKKPL